MVEKFDFTLRVECILGVLIHDLGCVEVLTCVSKTKIPTPKNLWIFCGLERLSCHKKIHFCFVPPFVLKLGFTHDTHDLNTKHPLTENISYQICASLISKWWNN